MEILAPQDASARAVAYLWTLFPNVGHHLPERFAYDSEFIVVNDTGGAGEYDHVLHEKRLTVEVWGTSWGAASAAAGQVYGALRKWPQVEAGVYWRRSVSAPQRYPDDTKKPRYVMTVELAFRASEEVIGG